MSIIFTDGMERNGAGYTLNLKQQEVKIMKIFHHKDFRHWVEMEIMAVFVIALLASMLLPRILSRMFF